MLIKFCWFSVLDSTAKIPDALLDLHHIFLGNIEECIDISVSPRQDGNERLPGFSGKYLYSKIVPNDQVTVTYLRVNIIFSFSF